VRFCYSSNVYFSVAATIAAFPFPLKLERMGLRLATHRLANVAVGLSWAVAFHLHTLEVVMVVAVAFLVDGAIDRLGHEEGGYGPKRTERTHGLFTAPFLGALIGLLLQLVVAWLLGWFSGLDWTAYASPLITTGICEGVLAGFVHLTLDSTTERGIYMWGKRRRLAGWRSDDPDLNGVVAAFSWIVIMVAFVARWPWILIFAEELVSAEPILQLVVLGLGGLFAVSVVVRIARAAKSRNAVPLPRRTWSGRQPPQAPAVR